MTDRMPDEGSHRTTTVAHDDRPVDGSSHAVHTEDIVQRFDQARDERARARPVRGGDAAPQDQAGPQRETTPLVSDEQVYRSRWETVQTGFVDEPRRAVEQADALVADVIKELVSSFAEERGRLEAQWSEGNEASTEDLRVALKRYRAFFDRLLVA